MNDFRLFAHGPAFDPDAYLAETPLKFDGVWHKGEAGNDHPKSSGVFKILGDGRTMPTFEQEQIAIEFLAANREALKALATHAGVTTFVLGLQYHLELTEGIVGFAIGPPARLMAHAVSIGIEPIYYVTLGKPPNGEASPPGSERPTR
jgi:hypothetical protein